MIVEPPGYSYSKVSVYLTELEFIRADVRHPGVRPGKDAKASGITQRGGLAAATLGCSARLSKPCI